MINDSDKKENRTIITKPDCDKPLYQRGYKRAVEDLSAKGNIVPPLSEHRDNVVEMQATPAIDKADPYALWYQIDNIADYVREDACKWISSEVGKDSNNDRTYVDRLLKEIKAQRKELALAAKAGD